MTYFHKLFVLIALCTIAACVDQPDDEAPDEVAREIATDEVDDIEVGMSEVQQVTSVSFSCQTCVASYCASYVCSPQMRYDFAHTCYRQGRCSYSEYQTYRPRFQTP